MRRWGEYLSQSDTTPFVVLSFIFHRKHPNLVLFCYGFVTCPFHFMCCFKRMESNSLYFNCCVLNFVLRLKMAYNHSSNVNYELLFSEFLTQAIHWKDSDQQNGSFTNHTSLQTQSATPGDDGLIKTLPAGDVAKVFPNNTRAKPTYFWWEQITSSSHWLCSVIHLKRLEKCYH